MSRRWSPVDDALLIEFYAQGLPRRQIGKRLARTPDAIDVRRRALGQPRRTPPPSPWSEAEDRFLVAASAGRVPAAEIAERLGRSRHAIRQRRSALGLTRPVSRRYSSDEDGRIASALARGSSLALIAAELGRSEQALHLRAKALGLVERSTQRARWRPDEDVHLRTGYESGLSAKMIHETLLPARRPSAIVARARLLGLPTYARRWSPDEDEQLKLLVRGLLPLDTVATVLHRSRESIVKRCHVHGLPTPSRETAGRHQPWRSHEDELLRRNHHRDTLSLARLTGRSEAAIRRRRKLLGLVPPPRSQHHAPVSAKTVLLGKRRRIEREGRLTPTRLLAASRRLDLPLHDLRKLADPAQTSHYA